MTYLQALRRAIDICQDAGELEVAGWLRRTPQLRFANHQARLRGKLAAAGIDLPAILAECSAASEAGDITQMKVANAKLGMALTVMNATPAKEPQ